MGDGTNWIANAFKFFDELIGALRLPQPDRSMEAPAQSDTHEAAAASPPITIHPEPASEGEAPARQGEVPIETPSTQEIRTSPVQQDDETRRKLIRQLFNQYWTGVEDKPPTFAERLQIAERYINDQLADRDIEWRLDATTRKQLGLPSTSTIG